MPSVVDTEFYICEHCNEVVNRMFIAPLKKYIFPTCGCIVDKNEKWREDQERLHRKKQMEKAYRQNIINESLTAARFDNFTQREGAENLYNAALEFAKEFESRKQGLLIFGAVGNGKSHLAASIHHYLDERNYVSLFLDCSQLFNIAEDAKKYSSKSSVVEIVNAAIGCDLLTLDELGAGKITQDEFTDILFPIINGRQGKITNFTTNLNLDEIGEWLRTDKYKQPLDDKGRLLDRIIGNTKIIQNNGTSYRREQRLRLVK
jgi:DNA replication protein DnaC